MGAVRGSRQAVAPDIPPKNAFWAGSHHGKVRSRTTTQKGGNRQAQKRHLIRAVAGGGRPGTSPLFMSETPFAPCSEGEDVDLLPKTSAVAPRLPEAALILPHVARAPWREEGRSGGPTASLV